MLNINYTMFIISSCRTRVWATPIYDPATRVNRDMTAKKAILMKIPLFGPFWPFFHFFQVSTNKNMIMSATISKYLKIRT